jgi:hypothetical protein
LLNGIICTLWGIALIIFALGFVPVGYDVQRQAIRHANITNVVIATVASIATTHTKYVFTSTVELYATYLLVDGFTLRQLQRMQGVTGWLFFKPLKPLRRMGHTATRLGWIILYAGMVFHTASMVAILQPSESR